MLGRSFYSTSNLNFLVFSVENTFLQNKDIFRKSFEIGEMFQKFRFVLELLEASVSKSN